MSVLSNVEAKLGIIETDIVHFFTTTLPNFEHKVESEVQQAASWLVNKALPWLEAHGQEIAGDVAGVVGVLGVVAASGGTGIPIAVLTAAQKLNTGVALVNTAIAAAEQAATASAASGASVLAQAIAAGGGAYAGLKDAQAATAEAQKAVVATATPAR